MQTKNIRWRLISGAISLVAAVALTLPAAASRVDLAHRVADLWPNGLAAVGDIWPNDADFVLSDVIWPNAGVIGGQLAGSDGAQDSQGNQDPQN